MERDLRKLLPNGNFPSRRPALGAVKGKGNRSTERRLRAALVQAGMTGWRLHADTLPGRPDFYFPDARLVVFADGCFWHGCPKCGHVPNINRPYWSAKIVRNQQRDAANLVKLNALGLRALRIWEHEIADDLGGCVSAIARLIDER